MEFFQRAKAVRLRSQHNKFLTASPNEESVKQSRTGSSKSARWIVEPVDGKPNLIRFKSAETWKYLSASNEPFLLGMTGKKVVQASPLTRSDPAVEWEPVKDGSFVRLRTRKGNFLRANGGIPPWLNSVTHDSGSTSSRHNNWVLWMVDILEVEYQSQPLVVEEEEVVVVSVDQTVGGEDDDDHHNHDDEAGFSRSSSYSECYDEIGSPARSVKSSMEISAGVSPLIQHHLRQESQHTNSFHKLKSVLDGINNLIDDDYEEDNLDSDVDSKDSISRPHSLDVKMAKQVLKELKNMNFSDILSSEREKKLEKAVEILVSDAKHSNLGQVPKDLIYLQDSLKSMKNDHELASEEIMECTSFSTKKINTRAELKKDAAKAHELEYMEVGFTNMLATSRAKRDELLRQLEEIENSIKAAERAQADNAVEIEELITRIGERSVSLREMEMQEKTLQARKVEAERTLERVEEEWVEVKSMFEDV